MNEGHCAVMQLQLRARVLRVSDVWQNSRPPMPGIKGVCCGSSPVPAAAVAKPAALLLASCYTSGRSPDAESPCPAMAVHVHAELVSSARL